MFTKFPAPGGIIAIAGEPTLVTDRRDDQYGKQQVGPERYNIAIGKGHDIGSQAIDMTGHHAALQCRYPDRPVAARHKRHGVKCQEGCKIDQQHAIFNAAVAADEGLDYPVAKLEIYDQDDHRKPFGLAPAHPGKGACPPVEEIEDYDPDHAPLPVPAPLSVRHVPIYHQLSCWLGCGGNDVLVPASHFRKTHGASGRFEGVVTFHRRAQGLADVAKRHYEMVDGIMSDDWRDIGFGSCQGQLSHQL